MLIKLANLTAKVAVATDDELEWLEDYLSFPDERQKHRRRSHWSDGKIHMMSSANNSFPAGFIDVVRKAGKEEKIKIDVLDERKVPCLPDPRADIGWLYAHQKEAAEVAREEERGVFWHVTAAGKTEVMVAVGEIYPIRWGIFVHRKDLLHQTAERFLRRTGERVGIIGDGYYDIKRITIAMFNSVYAKLRSRGKQKKSIEAWLQSLKGTMTDECHVAPAKTFWRVEMATPNAYFRYGFSGTPFARSDKKSIFTWGAIGPVIHRVTAERLIKAKIIARPKIRMVPVKQMIEGDTWHEAYANGVKFSKPRNKALAQLAQLATKPCLLFVKEIDHGKLIERSLTSKGVSTEFVWGAKKTEVRQAAIRRLVHGDTDVLICNVIFQEGIDIPELQSVIIGSGGKSTIMALQDIGRGMRRHDRQGREIKAEFEVYDIFDEGCGCASDRKHRGCKWMERHRRKRIAAYSVEKYETVRAVNLLK